MRAEKSEENRIAKADGESGEGRARFYRRTTAVAGRRGPAALTLTRQAVIGAWRHLTGHGKSQVRK